MRDRQLNGKLSSLSDEMSQKQHRYEFKGVKKSLEEIRALIAERRICPLSKIRFDGEERHVYRSPEFEDSFDRAGYVPTGRFDNVVCSIVFVVASLQALATVGFTFIGWDRLTNSENEQFRTAMIVWAIVGLVANALSIWFGIGAFRSRKFGFVGLTLLFLYFSASFFLRNMLLDGLFFTTLGTYFALRWRGLFAAPWTNIQYKK